MNSIDQLDSATLLCPGKIMRTFPEIPVAKAVNLNFLHFLKIHKEYSGNELVLYKGINWLSNNFKFSCIEVVPVAQPLNNF